MNIHYVRPDPPGHLALVLQFLDGLLHHVGPGRVQYDELIGMETGPQFVPLGESSALLEATNDLITFWQIVNGITALGMCLEWKNPAVDPKAAYPVIGAELK